MIIAKLMGVKRVAQALKKEADKSDGYMGAALMQEALSIMGKSVRLVPVDTGRLRATAYVAPPQKSPTRGVYVEIGYGTKYGVYVHERTDVEHAGATQAKFLEQPLNQAERGYLKRIGKRVQRNIKTGTFSIPSSPYKSRPSYGS